MEPQRDPWALIVFGTVIVCTFIAAWKGRRDTDRNAEAHLSQQGLNRWLVALSAGSAANSGFVVTGAVGLGYSYGIHWLLLPFGWFLGDLIFWKFFPHRINNYARKAQATTLADLLTHGLKVGRFHPLSLASTVIVVLCLGGYTMAQWVAGQKFVDGAFGVSGHWTLIVFAALIVLYSSLGEFRGSVYADTFQAITRLLAVALTLGTVCWVIAKDPDTFMANIRQAGDGFFDILGGGTIVSVSGFVFGYAAAALGFGLAQPHVTSRYIAARDPAEAKAARWIYIIYVQWTWATMTVFGVLLRGVMPNLADPEKGLTVFIAATLPPVILGFIAGDIFGEIASTANSLLVAMAQATRDLFGKEHSDRVPLWILVSTLGVVTMLAAIFAVKSATVFDICITSISLMAAGLAPAVAAKVLDWRHTAFSLTVSVFVGFALALLWKGLGYADYVNESAIGIGSGMLINYLFSRRASVPNHDALSAEDPA